MKTAALVLSVASAGIAATSDVTHLPVGDNRYSSSARSGYVYLCPGAPLDGGPPPIADLPWMNGDGTYDAAKKTVVHGKVTWPSRLRVGVRGQSRIITGNGLPSHPTGTFPVSPDDPAFAYGPNPNGIRAQNISLVLPANPTVSAQPSCLGMGPIGIMLTGAVFFNAFDADGLDGNAHETQDACGGHPQMRGMYHYHRFSPCSHDTSSGHSALIGYAFDGFGIYGPRGENGKILTDADLDACHGHTHAIMWNGKRVVMYHYHVTAEFPYTMGCYRGTPVLRRR